MPCSSVAARWVACTGFPDRPAAWNSAAQSSAVWGYAPGAAHRAVPAVAAPAWQVEAAAGAGSEIAADAAGSAADAVEPAARNEAPAPAAVQAARAAAAQG